LVLDNCEHLLDAVARVVDAITRRSPDVVILATSREGLAVAGEHLVAVPALGVPREGDDRDDLAESEAVRLFVDRARDAEPDFALTADNVEAVGQLCRRLDGIPLAIELAAARVRSLTPDDLVARLDQRFRLLTRGSRAALERHQTLRNTVDWSYNLLGEDEQVGLNRLSVFAGGCDLDAAEAILAPDGEFDAVDVLSQLVDKSLALADDEGGRRRYRLLETIRQYAQEQLEASGQTAQTRRNHAEYFVALAERAGPHLRSRDQLEWAAKLTRDSENLRTALDWAVELESADHALRLVAPFMVVGLPMGWTITDWADLATAVPGADTHPLYPPVVAYAARGAAIRNDRDRAQHLVAMAQAAQRALGTDHLWVHQAAGVVAVFLGDLDTAAGHAQTWLAGARERDDPYEVSFALSLLASGLRVSDPPRAQLAADEAIRLAREHGIGSALLYALLARASLPTDPGEKYAFLDEATSVATALGDHYGAARTDGLRGLIAAREGEWGIALHSFVRVATAKFAVDETQILPEASRGAAIALAHLGDLEGAAVMLSFAETNFPGMALDAVGAALLTETREFLRDGLPDIELAQLTARGVSLSTRDAITLMRDAAGSHRLT
jgi:predicted ATPase